jgi:hypothetical protein
MVSYKHWPPNGLMGIAQKKDTKERKEYNTRGTSHNSQPIQGQGMTQPIDTHRSSISTSTEQHNCWFCPSLCTMHHSSYLHHPSGIGTKGGRTYTKQNSPETMTSLKADGNTSRASGLHVPSSDAIQGEESLKGNGESGGWHHPAIGFLSPPTRRASTKQRRQCRELFKPQQ